MIRRLGAIVLTALAVLVLTGLLNTLYLGGISVLLAVKLVLVAVVIALALYQYANLGARIWRLSADGPAPETQPLLARLRRVGVIAACLVLLIVYLSLGLSRIPSAIVALSFG